MRPFAAIVLGTCWAVTSLGAQGRLTGTVYDSLVARGPMRGAMIVLIEQGRYTTSDDRGRFTFDSVAEGRHTIGFMHPDLDTLDIYVPPVAVEMPHSGRTSVALATPSATTVYAALCPGTRDEDTGVLIGRVRDVETDDPVAGATVGTSWTEIVLSSTARDDRRRGQLARSDAQGVFRLCGIPVRLMLDVRAEANGASAGPQRLALDARLIGRVTLALSRPKPGEARAASAIGRVRGTVRDRSGHVVRDALVGLLDDPRTVRTNSDGLYRLDSVPAGTRTLEARKMGAPPSFVSINVRADQELQTDLTIDRSAQALAPITVVGRRTLPLIDRMGFAERRRVGVGDFFTAEDIARLGAFDLTDVIGRMRGMQMAAMDGGYLPMMRSANGTLCIPNFFVDGAMFPVDGVRPGPRSSAPFTDLTTFILPHMVRGIEVYSSLGAIPPEYDRSALTQCGTVLIWTH